MTTRHTTGRCTLAGGLALLACAVAHSQQPATFTPEQLRQDVTAIEAAIERTHPDISHSVDSAVLGRAIEDVRAKLDHSMSAGEAWTVLSRLNSVMADGHLAVTYPGGAANEIRQYVKQGGRLFPYAVHVTPEAEVFVRARLDETATPLAGRRIEMLDDVTAHDVAEKLLAHMNGDTVALRAQLLSERFAFWYWKFYGERKTVRLRIAGADSIVEASSATPRAFQEKSFEQLFRLDLLDDAGALLTIDEFYWRDKPQFYAFTREAFARMRNAGTRTLIIDIRANPGGDDDVWIEGIMPYIATRSFSNGSSYRLKIIEGRQKEGQKVGDVVRSSQETQYPPQLDNLLRFKGKVYVLISPRTYSSAVLFSTVMQDGGFGTLAGTGGGARSTQSGGTQNIKLPNTQMTMVVPRFVLTRSSGGEGLLQPDLMVVDDPFRPMAAVEALMRHARGQ
jgi:Peptidase family S41